MLNRLARFSRIRRSTYLPTLIGDRVELVINLLNSRFLVWVHRHRIVQLSRVYRANSRVYVYIDLLVRSAGKTEVFDGKKIMGARHSLLELKKRLMK